MTLFKAQRVALVAILGTLSMGALSLLPGAGPFGSQIAGAQAVTTLTLINPSTAPFGTPVTFSADLENGNAPTGSISLAVFTDTACNTLAFTMDANVDAGNGTYTLGTTTPVAPGNYYGDAFYASGDTGPTGNDNASSGSCTGLILMVEPAAATTSLTLSASPNPAPLGTPVTFTADLEGGSSPTGTISLAAYLNDPTCGLVTPTFSQDVSVTGSNGPYNFAPVTPAAAGSYYGEAFYASGDTTINDNASSGSCDLILVVSPSPHHVRSCRTVLNLGPTFLDLIYMEGPHSAFTLYIDSLAPCVIP